MPEKTDQDHPTTLPAALRECERLWAENTKLHTLLLAMGLLFLRRLQHQTYLIQS